MTGFADLPLTGRQRSGLTLAIVALSLTMNPINRQVRFWVRDQLLEGRWPYWLEKTLVMVTFATLFWSLLGWLLLGWRRIGLQAPERPREAWVVALFSGLGLLVLLVPALALSGTLAWQFKLNLLANLADLVSNFEEELIGRGVILGLLLVALGRQRSWWAATIEGALFCQGHAHYPPPLLAVVFVAGVCFSWMTIRYRSILPAWVSHNVVDLLGDTILKT